MDLSEVIKKQNGEDEELVLNNTVDDVAGENEEDEEFLSDVNIIQLVSFTLDDVEYGVDILSVHDILRIPDLTRLPNTPPFIKGVINLRGNVIPVVDVRIRFGFPVSKLTEQSRIIVIETVEKQVGLLVDNVHQVVRIPDVNIDSPSSLIAGVSEEFVTGIGRMKEGLIVILNMSHIIFLEDEEKRMALDF